jgi:hypothetical protein
LPRYAANPDARLLIILVSQIRKWLWKNPVLHQKSRGFAMDHGWNDNCDSLIMEKEQV